MRVAILRDNKPDSSLKWEIACQNRSIDYIVIDMLQYDWLFKLEKYKPNLCVSRPPGDLQQSKLVFDQKLFFIEKYTTFPVFPGYHETVIYENKATLAYFLEVNKIPHPKTIVSYSYREALELIEKERYPLVAKTLIGAAGSGVKIIKKKSDADSYIKKAFSAGIKRRYGPNRKTGNPKSWMMKSIHSPAYLFKKIKLYKERNHDVQKNVVLFQQYIPHDYEWRCAKIGESYFAYKKLRIGDKASGSKQFEYGAPPLELLDFTKSLCEKFNFNFMTVDLYFINGRILVNELQTIFGHKNSYICKVDGNPGRYIYKNNQWIFEEGEFNTNESYDLRLKTAIEIYKKQGK